MRAKRTLVRPLLATALVVLAASAPAAAQPAAQPNLVFILTDDQRLETLAVMPNTRAAFGVEFTQAVATTPSCCPSRSSFLTGKWVHSTGVYTTRRAGYQAFQRFEPDSLGPWLQAAGYYTGFVGKYFNAYVREDGVPPGWDEFFGRVYGADAGDGAFTFAVRKFRAADGHDSIETYPSEAQPEAYSTRVYGAEAEAFLRRAADPAFNPEGKPFALILWTTAVNTPLVEPVYADARVPAWLLPPSFLEPDMSDKPHSIRRRATATFHQAEADRLAQLRQSLSIDDVIGDLIDTLDELGVRANTWGVFASDHGRQWGEHGLIGKWVAYEESVRIPLRLMVPGGATRTVPALVANVDVAPTLTALAGDTASHGFEGRSLLPLVEGSPVPWRSNVLLEYFPGSGWCGIRGERWKYIQHGTGAEELYHLRADPYELDSRHRTALDVVMVYRRKVAASMCRPPRLTPLPACTIEGTPAADRIRGTRRPDWICAGHGRDVVRVRGGGRDVVDCGRGGDTVYADRADVVRACEWVLHLH